MASFELPVVKPAVTLGSVNTLIGHSAIMAAIGLYNSGGADATVTVKDSNGKIITASLVPAGQTIWLDFARICVGKGFYFQGGVFASCDVAAAVTAWLAGYEETNIVPPYQSAILKPAVTLPLSAVLVSRDCMVSAIGLYNSHNAAVTVTPQDATGKKLAPVAVAAGTTAYLDWANISNGLGFFFSGGLTLAADVAGKVDAWVAGYTQG